MHKINSHGRRSSGAAPADRAAHSRMAMYVLGQADFSLTMKIYTSETAGRFGRVASEGRHAPEISS